VDICASYIVVFRRQLRDIADVGTETDDAVAAALRDCGETLQPALLALETKSTKFVQLGLGYIQRLAGYDAVNADQFLTVGQSLRLRCMVCI
jgi:hypothetical protein